MIAYYEGRYDDAIAAADAAYAAKPWFYEARRLVGSTGRLLAVVIMIVGVSLFIRLVQTIFRPKKVQYRCPECGLSRHDADAVHCKHCGHVVNIESEGE